MKKIPYDLAVRLKPIAPTSAQTELAQRIQLVLETQTGQLPWAPEFGTDLVGLVGRTADQARRSEARVRITAALQRWLPDLEFEVTGVELVDQRSGGGSSRGVPLAEAAMTSGGASGGLQINIVAITESGPVEVQAQLVE